MAEPDEEVAKLNSEGDMLSAVGNGVYGSILGYTSRWTGEGQGRPITYATGEMDNTGSPGNGGDDYQGKPARHGDGANFVADDLHAIWLVGHAVSAGWSARDSSRKQSSTGCGFALGRLPCAEGTAVQAHKLTFSTN